MGYDLCTSLNKGWIFKSPWDTGFDMKMYRLKKEDSNFG